MIKEFLEGSVYRNEKYKVDHMVFAVAEDNDEEVVLAVMEVDRDDAHTITATELVIPKDEFDQWKEVWL